MKRFVMTSVIALACLALTTGCDKGSDGSSKSSGGAPAASLPVKGPWEAIKITMTKKDPDGTGHFRIDNLGSKTVIQIYADLYAYDAKGKQLAHKDEGFSRSIKGGASDEFSTDPLSNVDTWEAVYHGIQFEGDAKPSMDDKRAPFQRAKGAH